MSWFFKLIGSASSNVAEVDSTNRLKVNLATGAAPAELGGVLLYSENDDGTATGTPYIASPETDDDYRLRTSTETLFDCETFNYTAQNTGKHIYRNTTMTNAWATSGMTTNSGNITTTTTGTSFCTYAEFPILGAAQLYCEMEASLTASATTNTIIDFGLFRPNTSNPYGPTDGVYFRLTSAGIFGVINSNGTETAASPFSFSYTTNRKYQFIIAVHEREVEFWIDNTLYGTIQTPAGQGQPCMSASLPLCVRHAITGGAAGAALSFTLNDYTVSSGGTMIACPASVIGNRVYGSYQGLSGGTMGSLATYANSANPTAAAPSNTALTANLPGGLGGQGLVTAAAGGSTDGIWGSYQVPAGTVSIQGRRLKIVGLVVDAVNTGAAVATTATTLEFSLAFGHNAVSLAASEAATTKAPRRLPLGFMTWAVGAGIGAGPQSGPIKVDLREAPVYVNPGEYVQLVGKFIVGTATASQTIFFTWTPVYGWE